MPRFLAIVAGVAVAAVSTGEVFAQEMMPPQPGAAPVPVAQPYYQHPAIKGGAKCGNPGCQSCGAGHGRGVQSGFFGPHAYEAFGHWGSFFRALHGHPHSYHPHHYANGWDGLGPMHGPAANPTGAVAYPYYTVRGPRDFLLNNPPPLGY